MTKYELDYNGEEIFLGADGDQIMMEWECDLMKAEVDMLQPKGHVLELGFGLGMSATFIQEYNPMSHTIIEVDDNAFERAQKWAKDKKNVNLVKGRLQDVLGQLPRKIYDETFFDVTEVVNPQYKDVNTSNMLLQYLTYIFVDVWYNHHSKIGSKLTFFVADFNWPDTYNYQKLIAENPNWIHTCKMIDVDVPENCKYRSVPKAIVTLLERVSQTNPKHFWLK